MSNKTEKDNLEKNDILRFLESSHMADFAGDLKQNTMLYTIYGASDGLSVTFSTLKYFCDVISPNKDIYLKHLNDVLTSEAGLMTMAVFACTTVFITGLSIFANRTSTKKTHSEIESLFHSIWPYLRNSLKGAKNTYKASKATLILLNNLSYSNHNYLLGPIGLGLGAACVANRIWYLHMDNKRKSLLKENELLLEKIIKCTDPIKLIEYQSQIKLLNVASSCGYLSNLIAGIIDGPYLLIGIMGLASFTAPALIALSITLACFYLTSIIARVHEEYQKQKLFKISRLRCEYEIQYSLFKLGFFKRTELENQNFHQDLIKQRLNLINSQKNNYFSLIIEGMNDGLKVFGVCCSLLFAYATISLLFAASVSISPLIIGLSFIAGISAMLYRVNHYLEQHNLNTKLTENEQEKIDHDKASYAIEAELGGNKDLADPTTQGHFQEYCEVARASTSGLSKGNNLTDLMFSTLKERTEDGTEATPATRLLFFAIGSVNAVCLGLRAIAKGLKKPKPVVRTTKLPSFQNCSKSAFFSNPSPKFTFSIPTEASHLPPQLQL